MSGGGGGGRAGAREYCQAIRVYFIRRRAPFLLHSTRSYRHTHTPHPTFGTMADRLEGVGFVCIRHLHKWLRRRRVVLGLVLIHSKLRCVPRRLESHCLRSVGDEGSEYLQMQVRATAHDSSHIYHKPWNQLIRSESFVNSSSYFTHHCYAVLLKGPT